MAQGASHLAGEEWLHPPSIPHLDHLVGEGKIPDAGRPGTPRIARRHLPEKTGAATPRLASQPPRREVPTAQIVQSVIDRGG